MNTDEYYDDAPLPADALVAAFVLADFDANVDRRRERAGKPNGVPWGVVSIGDVMVGDSSFHPRVPKQLDHLRDCPNREVDHMTATGEHTCGEGTCDYDPEINARIRCPHGSSTTYTVSADTMAELIDRITAFAP